MPAQPSHALLVPVAHRSCQAVFKLHERIVRGLGPEVDATSDETAIVLG